MGYTHRHPKSNRTGHPLRRGHTSTSSTCSSSSLAWPRDWRVPPQIFPFVVLILPEAPRRRQGRQCESSNSMLEEGCEDEVDGVDEIAGAWEA